MCGIVGYVGDQETVPILIGGLAKLEYRGYDSAGVAVLQGDKIEIRRTVGKLANLQKSLKEKELKGTVGIGHTRWATHGKPSEQNAHPHRSKGCVLVHNGIIENYQPLKQQLEKEGYKFHSETDTEVVAHLIDQYLQRRHEAGRGGTGRHEGCARELCARRHFGTGTGDHDRGALRMSAGRGHDREGVLCRVGRHGHARPYP